MSIPYPPGIEFRPLRSSDVRAVGSLIAQVDDDDAENAIESYRRDLNGHYVLTQAGAVIGVTGALEAPNTDRAWWLSWTYLDESHRGTGLGALLLEALFAELEHRNARKIFVNTSDYIDAQKGRVYEDAMHAYQRVGFVEELRHRDYYAPGESLITLGLRLQPAEDHVTSPDPHDLLAAPTDFGEIEETDGAYYIDWEFMDDQDWHPEPWDKILRGIAKRRGRVAFGRYR